jgi:membrane-associated phospholipid phosphatase
MRLTARSPVLAAAACFLAFGVLLACAYAVAPIGRLDATALEGLTALDNSVSGLPVRVAVHSADPLPLTLMLAALFAWGWSLGRRREAVAAVALVGGTNLIALALQIALAHPRYHQALGGDQVGAQAFPSGHATSAMSIALAAVLVAPARARVTVASVAAAYVIAVSTSLLVLGWHFPSDVLGGLLFSSGAFFLAAAAMREGAARRAGVAARRARLALSPGLGGVAVAVLAGTAVIVLSRAEEVMAFARLHTVAAATALAIIAISAGLLASATLIANR